MKVTATIMRDTSWTLIGEKFEDPGEFSAAVRQEQIEVHGGDWQPDEVVLPAPRVQVGYYYWNDNDEQVPGLLDLKAANGESFTALDLLYQIHNAVVEQVRDEDHHFFEGLAVEMDLTGRDIARATLHLGS